jgi:hypothetical protein
MHANMSWFLATPQQEIESKQPQGPVVAVYPSVENTSATFLSPG